MMSAKTVVLLIQNVLTKKFIHFNPSTGQVELQADKFSKGMSLSYVYAIIHNYMLYGNDLANRSLYRQLHTE